MAGKPTSFLTPQLIFFLSIIAGTLAWGVLAAFLALGDIELGLSTGPVGFDAGVLSFYIEVNPGTFAGLFVGYRLGKGVAGGRRSRSSSGSRRSRSKSGAGSSRRGSSKAGGGGAGNDGSTGPDDKGAEGGA